MPLSTNELLISILQVLRTQTVYLDRQHGLLIAVADTLRSVSDDVAEDLRAARILRSRSSPRCANNSERA